MLNTRDIEGFDARRREIMAEIAALRTQRTGDPRSSLTSCPPAMRRRFFIFGNDALFFPSPADPQKVGHHQTLGCLMVSLSI